MNYDILFAPVGADSSKAGDAIHIRYREPDGVKHMVVDGGTKESGQWLVDDIKATGGDYAVVDHMVLTHPDADHVSGLRIVLEQLGVRNLYLNPPWEFAGDALPYFANKRLTEQGLKDFLKDRYDLTLEVMQLAEKQGTNMYLALAGTKVGPFTVLSPTRYAMARLLSQFDHAKDPDIEALKKENWLVGTPSVVNRLVDTIFEGAEKALAKLTHETWDVELLRDGGITSACNESSVVMYGQFGNHKALLTGDAGEWGLRWAADYAEGNGLPLRQFNVVQIPHHGSRRNVGPTNLNRLVGPILLQGSGTTFTAMCSAPQDDADHPRKMVLNAFSRRGAKVAVTRGNARCSPLEGFDYRPGWGPGKVEPFYDQVEDYT